MQKKEKGLAVNMEWFCTDEERAALKNRERRLSLLFRALAGFAVIAFVVLCFMIRTENMIRMHLVLMAVTILTGWICIILYKSGVREARTQLAHLDMLRDGEAEIREGFLTVTREAIQIPKSIRIRKVLLDAGKEEPERLNLDERWISRMPSDGSRVRFAVIHSYISGCEITEAAEGEERSVSRRPSVLRKVAALLPLLGIWMIAAVFFSSFVFYQITDTDPEHKITIYVDCDISNETELAARLEKGLSNSVRMVQIHSFHYAMFGSEALKSADLYIVPDSETGQYAEWFAPEEESILMYDPDSGISVAEEWFIYAQGETYRLYIGAYSPHMEDGLSREAAELLEKMENEEEKK